MKKTLLFLIFCFTFPQLIQAQNPGDTILVQTFIHDAWTDGNGNTTASLGSPRDTIAYFPTDTTLTFEKIIMSYNMRCKDNNNNNTGGTSRIGCGAYDYSCHTYVHDSTRVDSILNFTPDYIISNFSGSTFPYKLSSVDNIHHYIQYNAIVDSTINEDTIILTGPPAGGAFTNRHKRQFLYSQFIPQHDTILSALKFFTDNSSNVSFIKDFRIRLKSTNDTLLSVNNPHLDGFTEVYYSDTYIIDSLLEHRFQFYQPFTLDSGACLIIEFSNSYCSPTTNIIKGFLSNDSTSIETMLNAYIELQGSEHVNIPVDSLGIISDEVTIALWVYGDQNMLPANTSLFEALDNNGNRTMNVHLPWSNGRVYWDCGNSGSSYDRIDKAANLIDYAGKWNHWAFTKNANTGEMKIYLNGNLWHSGLGKTHLINIDSFTLGSNGNGNANFWHGKILDIHIFKEELSSLDISEIMYQRPLSQGSPHFSKIADAYMFTDLGRGMISASSTNPSSNIGPFATLNGFVKRDLLTGVDQFTYFYHANNKPIIQLYSGNYIVNIQNDTVIDYVASTPKIVTKRDVFPNYGSALNDSIGVVSVDTLWQAIREISYHDTAGVVTNTYQVLPDSTIVISNLQYYKRLPMAFQIMSFVTPYGMGVDFGQDGKSWDFDVTDYSPLLKGSKRMTISGGGQWQEDLDIKFYFIVGTPPRDVKEIQQIWRPQSKNHSTIMSDEVFEPRTHRLLSNASSFKLRSYITGHGQDGEFIPRIHYLNVDAANPPIKSWQVWTECSENPVYPQGGTWIYDRAGWCPGQATDLVEVDITSLVTPGQNHIFDYGVNSTGSSNYWVSNQLVSYGTPNFTLDATISEIISPSEKIVHSRNNPTCSNPKIIIQNTGSSTLTSLTIEYWINNANNPEIFTWSGNLEFLEKEEIELPSTNSLWQSLDTNQNIFYAQSKNPNGSSDQYQFNDLRSATFEPTPIYPAFFGLCVQTNSGVTNSLTQYSETSWDLFDGQGNTIYSSGTLLGGTQYRDSITLNPGCYRFEVFDTDDDGLDFWANNDGSGIVRFITTPISCNAQRVKDFDGDFGRSIVHHFRVENITTFQDKDKYPWEIFPNPTKNSIQIKGFIDEETTLNIYSNLGKLLISQQLNFQGIISKEIDLSDFPTGVYFINIQNTQEKIIKKVVKL